FKRLESSESTATDTGLLSLRTCRPPGSAGEHCGGAASFPKVGLPRHEDRERLPSVLAERRHRPGPALLIDRDEGEGRIGDLLVDRRPEALGPGLDIDL